MQTIFTLLLRVVLLVGGLLFAASLLLAAIDSSIAPSQARTRPTRAASHTQPGSEAAPARK